MSSTDGLVECLRRVESGPWRFIQLRGDWPAQQLSFDGTDIDLLGTPDSVTQLITATRQWVREGLCHVRILRGQAMKSQLTIWSADGRHSVILDLWKELPQLDNGRSAIRFDDCAAAVADPGTGILRLPPGVEASLYVHHLHTKCRDLAEPIVRRRLQHYAEICGRAGLPELSEAIRRCADTGMISDQLLNLTRNDLSLKIHVRAASRSLRSLPQRMYSLWLQPPRQMRQIAIIGCDGAGKTSLGQQLTKNRPQHYTQMTGKHLYRKSLSYKLAVILIRPVVTRSRERFDEILAPLIFLRAAVRLRILVCWRRVCRRNGLLLIDRGLNDFLYVGRKSNQPRFTRWSWMSKLFGIRIPVIHLLVGETNLQNRKDEITKLGHAAYDEAMFRIHVERCPTDYLMFHNDRPMSDSADALNSLLSSRESNAEI